MQILFSGDANTDLMNKYSSLNNDDEFIKILNNKRLDNFVNTILAFGRLNPGV